MAINVFPTPGAGRTTAPSLQSTITSSQTVSIPSTVDTVYFIAVGGGGGGGNGITDSAGPSASGGAGGGSGWVNIGAISGIQLSSKLPIVIGAGGSVNSAGGTTVIGDNFCTASGGLGGFNAVALNGGTYQGSGGPGMSGGGQGATSGGAGGAGGANGANGGGSQQSTIGTGIIRNGFGNSYLTFKVPGGGGGGNGFIFSNAGSAGSSTAGTTSSGGGGGFRTTGTAGVLGQGGGGGGCNSTSSASGGAAGGSGVVYLYY